MGFGTELQGKQSHTALLQLQDTEIKLLENIKKCVTQRIKCDRDYANALSGMVMTAHKLESTDYSTPLFQTWSTVISETENVIKLIKQNADNLCNYTLERLVKVINDKKHARKTYTEEHSRLETEFSKLEDTMQKQQTDIAKLVAKAQQDKAKYEDVVQKGKVGSKLDDARNKYIRSETKLHMTHNEYVRGLKEVTLHQQGYVRQTLPELLNLQESIQLQLVHQSKNIIKECITHMDFSSDEFKHCHSSMHRSIDAIRPTGEYDEFITKFKSDPISLVKFEYKSSLLESYRGTLVVGELAVNNFTIDNLKQRKSSYGDSRNTCKSRKETKQEQLNRLTAELSASSPDNNSGHAAKERSKDTLLWEIQELECNHRKYSSLYELLSVAIDSVDSANPPQGISFSDNTSISSKDRVDQFESSTMSQKKNDIKATLAKRNPFKRTQSSNVQDVPEPPAKDFLGNNPGQSLSSNNTKPARTSDSSEQRTSTEASSDVGYQQGGGEPVKPLEDEEWFHGLLPREEVQRLLVNNGDFLVRESKNRKTSELQYVLSVMWNGHKHFIIQGYEGNWRFEAEIFPSIKELIDYQFASDAPVTKKSEAILVSPIKKLDWELRNDDVELGAHIDKGNFGEVFRGVYKPKKLDVAIKTCHETLSEEMKRKFLQEGRILKQYDHPNIVKFIGIAAQRHPVMIVMEYVNGGSLLNYLKKKGGSLSKAILVKMCEDASAGMAYLESKNCIHRDLAARNCLVDEKKNITKISDFGMSREEEEYTVSGGLKQIPIKWTAPEALNYGTYTSASDVWSFGVLMWEVFSFGKIPYPGLTNTQARERIEEGYRMPAPEGCPPSVHEWMSQCWQHEPKERPLFAVICEQLHNIRISTK